MRWCPKWILIDTPQHLYGGLIPEPRMRFYHSPTAIFLEEFEGHDLFYDRPSGLPTLIARYGDKIDEYRSGLFWAEFDFQLMRAKELAVERGLISDEDIEEATDVDDEISSCPHCLALEDEDAEDAICDYHMAALEDHFDCIHGWDENTKPPSPSIH